MGEVALFRAGPGSRVERHPACCANSFIPRRQTGGKGREPKVLRRFLTAETAWRWPSLLDATEGNLAARVLLPGRNSRPEIGEFDGVEQRDHVHDLPIGHLQIQGIVVLVSLSVPSRSLAVKKHDHHIAVCVNASYRRHEPARQPGVKRCYHLIEELLPVLI